MEGGAVDILSYAAPVVTETESVSSEGSGSVESTDSDGQGTCSRRQYKRLFLQVAIGISAFLIILIVYKMSRKTTTAVTPSGFTGGGDLSDRLSKAGWILYSKKGCGYCVEQIKLLNGKTPTGSIKCGEDPDAKSPLRCGDPKIRGYPFWYNVRTGASKTGLQNAAALESMCTK